MNRNQQDHRYGDGGKQLHIGNIEKTGIPAGNRKHCGRGQDNGTRDDNHRGEIRARGSHRKEEGRVGGSNR